MKSKLSSIICCLLLTSYAVKSYAQANRQLSNLISPTAVNQSLLPATNNTIDLGSTSLRWKTLHLENYLYLKGSITMHRPGTTNFFAGGNAGNLSVTGNNNTGIGQNSLYRLSSGGSNTGTGTNSLYSNTTGYANTATGASSLYYNTTGYANTATGTGSLYRNTIGYYNIAIGTNSLHSNMSGHYNTVMGSYSMYSNISGRGNTATGYQSLFRNTSGYYNTAMGYYSLYSNTGGRNTASGDFSLFANTTGSYNTAIGDNSLNTNTTGSYNTAIGALSLTTNHTGSYNTALGYQANVIAFNLWNATAIGYATKVNAPNKVLIGNTAVTSIGGQVGWSVFSDGRYKKDIKENVQGLVFINSLRPITYTINVKGLNEYYNGTRKQVPNTVDGADDAEIKKGEDAAGKIVYSGFVAQEVEAAAEKFNYEFSGVDKPHSKDGLYGLRYDNFIVPLVKAVQELSQQNDNLKKENEELKSRLDKMEAIVLKSQYSIVDPEMAAKLEQNIPNPSNGTTTIGYYLPSNHTHANINLYSSNGSLLKSVRISGNGKGMITVRTNELAAGIYQYALIINRKVVDSKKMVLIK